MSSAAGHFSFIGLGIMGEPMCRNLAQKSGATVIAYDRDRTYALRLATQSAIDATGARDADVWLRRAIEAGDGELYFPVDSRLIGRKH